MHTLLDRLKSISNKPSCIIRKGKKYLKTGQNPPKGVVTHRGPHGGIYYFVEDKHVKQAGKEHELIRSRGFTKDKFKELEEKYLKQGAESVHFVHVPGLERDKDGNLLYNLYVNWGDKTQKKIADKKAADKIRYGHPRTKDVEESEYTDNEGILTTPAYDRTDKGYLESGKYLIKPSGDRGAKLYYADKSGKEHKVKIAYDKVWGEKDEYDVNTEASREKNINTLKDVVKELNRSGKKRRDFYITNQARIDEEKAQEAEKNKNKPPKPPEKNPNWERHQMMNALRERLKKLTNSKGDEEEQNPLPGQIEEIDAHEDALKKKRGDKPVHEFLKEHLKKHHPDVPDKALDEAARSAFYRYSSDKKNPHRLSDAFQHGVYTLNRLLKHPGPEEKPKPGPVQLPPKPEPQFSPGKLTHTKLQDKRTGDVFTVHKDDQGDYWRQKSKSPLTDLKGAINHQKNGGLAEEFQTTSGKTAYRLYDKDIGINRKLKYSYEFQPPEMKSPSEMDRDLSQILDGKTPDTSKSPLNDWQEATYKDPRVAEQVMSSMQAAGKEVELLQNDWENKKGNTIRIRYRNKPKEETAPEKKRPNLKELLDAIPDTAEEGDRRANRQYERMQKQTQKERDRRTSPVHPNAKPLFSISPKKPETSTINQPQPAKPSEPKFKSAGQYLSREQAEAGRKREEQKGYEAVVEEKKFGNRTKYQVMVRKHPQKTHPEVSLPYDEGGKVRTWLRRIDGHVPGENQKNIGEFVEPVRSENGKHHYALPDGLYHGNMGSRAQNPDGEKYFHVKDGKVTEVPEGERMNAIRLHTPQISSDEFNQNISTSFNRLNDKQQAAKQDSSGQQYEPVPKEFTQKGELIMTGVNPGAARDLFFEGGFKYDPKTREYRARIQDLGGLSRAKRIAAEYSNEEPRWQSVTDKRLNPPKPLESHPESSLYFISGNTMQHKDAIKRAGGRWDRENKRWELSDSVGAIEKLKNLPGLKVDKYTYDTRPRFVISGKNLAEHVPMIKQAGGEYDSGRGTWVIRDQDTADQLQRKGVRVESPDDYYDREAKARGREMNDRLALMAQHYRDKKTFGIA